jgi:hypothetical protein
MTRNSDSYYNTHNITYTFKPVLSGHLWDKEQMAL